VGGFFCVVRWLDLFHGPLDPLVHTTARRCRDVSVTSSLNGCGWDTGAPVGSLGLTCSVVSDQAFFETLPFLNGGRHAQVEVSDEQVVAILREADRYTTGAVAKRYGVSD
jgi:hypothetical protein